MISHDPRNSGCRDETTKLGPLDGDVFFYLGDYHELRGCHDIMEYELLAKKKTTNVKIIGLNGGMHLNHRWNYPLVN